MNRIAKIIGLLALIACPLGAMQDQETQLESRVTIQHPAVADKIHAQIVKHADFMSQLKVFTDRIEAQRLQERTESSVERQLKAHKDRIEAQKLRAQESKRLDQEALYQARPLVVARPRVPSLFFLAAQKMARDTKRTPSLIASDIAVLMDSDDMDEVQKSADRIAQNAQLLKDHAFRISRNAQLLHERFTPDENREMHPALEGYQIVHRYYNDPLKGLYACIVKGQSQLIPDFIINYSKEKYWQMPRLLTITEQGEIEGEEGPEMVHPLLVAICNDNYEAVNALLKSGIFSLDETLNAVTNKRCKATTALGVASLLGKADLVSLLLQAGANPNNTTDELTPLMLAAACDQAQAVQELLSSPQTNSSHVSRGNGCSALHYAAYNGSVESLKLLLDAGEDVNQVSINGEAPLHSAAINNQIQCVDILLAHDDIIVDLPKKDGATPLFMAAQEKHKDIVRKLLQAGANVNCSRNNGSTPLSIAVENTQDGDVELLDILLKAGAQVNCTLTDGLTTPLRIAVSFASPEAVAFLLQNGALVNQVAFDESTPLHFAAERGDVAIGKLLLAAGADTKALYQGKTAYRIAKDNGCNDFALWLLVGQA